MSVDQPTVVFILSLSSDIGAELARHFLGEGAIVLGTYRRELPADLQANPRVVTRFFTDPAQAPSVSIETAFFAAQKQADSFRVFVQGESTAAGFPYGLGAALAGVLDQRLERLFPDTAAIPHPIIVDGERASPPPVIEDIHEYQELLGTLSGTEINRDRVLTKSGISPSFDPASFDAAVINNSIREMS